MTDPKQITDKAPAPENSTEQLEWLEKYLQLKELENIFDTNKPLDIDQALAFISRIEKVMDNLAEIIKTKIESTKGKNNKTNKVNDAIQKIDTKYGLRDKLDLIISRILEKDKTLEYLTNRIYPVINKINIRCGENRNSSESERTAMTREDHQPSHNHGRQHYDPL